MAALGWFGPLISISTASSHLGHYVQLIAFIHSSHSNQVVRDNKVVTSTFAQVGDDTVLFFTVSSWHKEFIGKFSAGSIVLFQNVKVTKFRDTIEAKTDQCSMILELLHTKELLSANDMDMVLGSCELGNPSKEKLRLVIEWVRQAGLIWEHDVGQKRTSEAKLEFANNWRTSSACEIQKCVSISELLHLKHSCHAWFDGCVGEIFQMKISDPVTYDVSISQKLSSFQDGSVADGLICMGCKLCGTPVQSCVSGRVPAQYFCEKSSGHFHDSCWIYRPFKLYLFDDSGHLLVTVKNKAAEVLFANITAESVCTSTRRCEKNICVPRKLGSEAVNNVCSSNAATESDRMLNFHDILLILLKSLLAHEQNSPFRFEVSINPDSEERFELVSFKMPLDMKV